MFVFELQSYTWNKMKFLKIFKDFFFCNIKFVNHYIYFEIRVLHFELKFKHTLNMKP